MNLGSSYPRGYFEPRFIIPPGHLSLGSDDRGGYTEQGGISKVVHRYHIKMN